MMLSFSSIRIGLRQAKFLNTRRYLCHLLIAVGAAVVQHTDLVLCDLSGLNFHFLRLAFSASRFFLVSNGHSLLQQACLPLTSGLDILFERLRAWSISLAASCSPFNWLVKLVSSWIAPEDLDQGQLMLLGSRLQFLDAVF